MTPTAEEVLKKHCPALMETSFRGDQELAFKDHVIEAMEEHANNKAEETGNKFDQGYACACANMMRDYGESTMVEECLRSNFSSIEDMRKSGVDEGDMQVLVPVINEIERKRKQSLK